jgi:hypothetical protein
MMREAPEKAEKMFELIRKEHNELRDEYFACKCDKNNYKMVIR